MLLTLAGIVVFAGIVVASLTFPTRSGCDDGTGAPSTDIPLYLCATPHSLLPMRHDTPVVPRSAVIGISLIVASMLAMMAFDTLPKASPPRWITWKSHRARDEVPGDGSPHGPPNCLQHPRRRRALRGRIGASR